MEWKFLVNCADEFEAGLIMGALDEKGIPTVKRHRDSVGDYMKIIGGVGKDVDIFVPDDKLQDALEQLQFFAGRENEEE